MTISLASSTTYILAMAEAHHQWKKSIWLQVALVSILVIHVVAAPEVNLLNTKRTRLVKPFKKPTAAIKTIQNEVGDIIDCVDIYKQPAFDHPALKNHTIQMRPSDYAEEMTMASKASSSLGSPARLSPTNGSCPEGTIPILRTWNNHLLLQNSITVNRVSRKAKLILSGGTYYGASATLNVWSVKVEPKEDSSSLVVLGDGENLIYAGWTVSELLYGDKDTRLTLYWTADDSRTTGCHNVMCAGFVLTNTSVCLGSPIQPTSIYGGIQSDIHIEIYLDRHSNNWWLKLDNAPVGYWPASIFKNFVTANAINWGGEVMLSSAPHCGGTSDFSHSTTQMGNGHYPSEGGVGISAYVFGALYRGRKSHHEPGKGFFYSDNPYCYAYQNYGRGYKHYRGISFFFGGDGQREGCF